MIRAGNVWYSDTEKGREQAREARNMIYRAWISERGKQKNRYKSTGKPPLVKIKFPDKDK